MKKSQKRQAKKAEVNLDDSCVTTISEAAEENVSNLFSLLDQNAGSKQRSKKERKSEKSSSSVKKTVQSISNLFGQSSAKLPENVSEETIARETDTHGIISWDESTSQRLQLLPWYSFSSYLPLVEKVHRDSQSNSAHGQTEKEGMESYREQLRRILHSITSNENDFAQFMAEKTTKDKKEEERKSAGCGEAEAMQSYLEAMKKALCASMRRGRQSQSTDPSLVYDESYWKHRTNKNRSHIPLLEANVVPEYHPNLFDDHDFVQQIQIERRNRCFPPLEHTETLFAPRVPAINLSETDSSLQPKKAKYDSNEKLRNFCSFDEKRAEPSSVVLGSLFGE